MTTVVPMTRRKAQQVPLATARQHGSRARWGFAEWFVVSQMVLPALLYLPGTQVARVPIRVSAYALSIGAILWWLGWAKRTSPAHPARPWSIAAIVYLT